MTRHHRVRRALTAGLVPLALVALSACGGGDPQADDPAAPTDEPTTASSSPTADAGEAMEPAEFVDMIQTGFDAVETAATTMRTEVTSVGTGMVMDGEGVVDYRTDPAEVAMVMNNEALGGEMDIRLVDGVMYLNMGGLSNGKFFEVDLNDPNNPLGAGFTNQLDPAASFAALEKGMEEVTFVGEEEIDGQPLRHYQASVRLQTMLEGMGQELPPEALKGMPELIDYDVWLDDEMRTHRMETDMGKLGRTEMGLSDFDAEVTIEAPDPKDVVDFPQMPSAPPA